MMAISATISQAFRKPSPGRWKRPRAGSRWITASTSAVTDADHPFQDGSSLVPKNEVYTLYADAEYQLTDDLTMYGEVLMSRRETYVNSYRQFWTYIYNEDFLLSSLSGLARCSALSPTPLRITMMILLNQPWPRTVGLLG